MFFQDESGRKFTSYEANCVIENRIKKQNGIKDNYEYKLFLQRNAVNLMKINTMNAMKDQKICDCKRCIEASERKF